MIEFVRGDLAAVGRTAMSHPDHDLRITLYPMFHVGSAAFYDALSEDLRRFRVFLLEGVRWKGLRGPLYDLAARNVGLVTQARLQLPEGVERLSLDMSEVEFTREAGAIPVHWRLLLRFLRPFLWAVTLTASGRHALWDAISKEKYARKLQAAETPLRQLIRNKRDKAMCDVLRVVVQDPIRIRGAEPIAVIAGAGHMPALYVTLRSCGYEKGSVRWFEVLDGVTVPSRSTDGRARSAGTRNAAPLGWAAGNHEAVGSDRAARSSGGYAVRTPRWRLAWRASELVLRRRAPMVRWQGMRGEAQPLPRNEELLGEIEKAETLLSRLEVELTCELGSLPYEPNWRLKAGPSPASACTSQWRRHSQCRGALRRKSDCFGSSSAAVETSSRRAS